LTEAGRDPNENAGFQLFFHPTEAETRLTSFSVLNYMPTTLNGTEHPPLLEERRSSKEDLRSELASRSVEHYAADEPTEYFAFKALPREFVTVDSNGPHDMDDEDRGQAETCKDVVDHILERIKLEIGRAQLPTGNLVKEADVIR
jgi:hypothetical protein